MVAEQNGLNDGADEQMLSGAEDNEKLADKREEVKFIKGGDHQNGDAKIDIGAVNGKVRKIKNKKKLFLGLTKLYSFYYAQIFAYNYLLVTQDKDLVSSIPLLSLSLCLQINQCHIHFKFKLFVINFRLSLA